jgi:hypothetical protein
MPTQQFSAISWIEQENSISGVMVSVLASSVVYLSDQIKDYKICICCFSARHVALRSKNKHLLAENHDNVDKLA